MYPAFGSTALTLLSVGGRNGRRMDRVKCQLCGQIKRIKMRYFVSGRAR